MPSKKKNKKQEPFLDTSTGFGELFDSMDDEMLIEMAYYQPHQLKTLCMFLTLDQQLAIENEQLIKSYDITG